MNQPDLFSRDIYGGTAPLGSSTSSSTCDAYGPGTANADPITSAEAEQRVTASGRRKRNVDIALAILRRNPGSTGHELFAAATEDERRELGDFPEIYRRLNDAKHSGQARQAEVRKCRVKGTRMITWEPAGA
jgi:hypothetical protein